MIGWVRLPPCRPSFWCRGADPPPIGKERGLILGQAIGWKGIGAQIPDAIHPEGRIPRVERLAQGVELHPSIVCRNDPLLDAALEPPECRCELVAFKQELAGPGIDEIIAIGLERHDVV